MVRFLQLPRASGLGVVFRGLEDFSFPSCGSGFSTAPWNRTLELDFYEVHEEFCSCACVYGHDFECDFSVSYLVFREPFFQHPFGPSWVLLQSLRPPVSFLFSSYQLTAVQLEEGGLQYQAVDL